MKTLKPSKIVPLSICIFLFAGCVPTSVTEIPASESAPATETPIPTQEPTPTATPLPVPCTIAFDSDRDGNRDIYIMDSDGNNLVNLTNNPADDFNPAWSPDGSQIAFVSFRDGQSGKIYVMNADGSDVHQLTYENGSDWPDWSHDGIKITYTDQNDIFVINADGSGQAINLTNSPETDIWPSWSPDGSQIVWSSGSDGHWNNFVMNADGSNVLQITDNGQVNAAQWTIEGRILTSWGWSNQEEFCHNCVVNADGTNIVDAGGKTEIQRYLPFRTLNGDRVEVANLDLFTGDEEIYLVGEMYPDTFLNLTNNPAQDRNPDWPAACLSGFYGNPLEESAIPETATAAPQNEPPIVESIVTKDQNPIELQNESDQWKGTLLAANLDFSGAFEMKLNMKSIGENVIGLTYTEGSGEQWWKGTKRMELSCMDGRLRVMLRDGTSESPVYEEELSMPSSGSETSCEITVKFDKSAKNIQFSQDNRDILLLTPEKVGDFQEGLFPDGKILKIDLSSPPHAGNSNSGVEFSSVKLVELIFSVPPSE